VSWVGKYGMRFHHATQNGDQFKTYKSFISRIFHSVFFLLQVIKAKESKNPGK
jgi:hypothetical protein